MFNTILREKEEDTISPYCEYIHVILYSVLLLVWVLYM